MRNNGSVWLYLMTSLLLMPFMANADEATFAPYQNLLELYLTETTLPGDGLVASFDYESAASSAKTEEHLADQRQRLANFDIDVLDSKAKSVAFWINTYNFFMLNQILTVQPDGKLVDSVWDYGGRRNPFVDSVFDLEKFDVGGQLYSLNQIEKGTLLGDEYHAKGWKDARVHFAVNCASVGCPPLRKAVYTADNLELLLAENTRRALSTSLHLVVDGGRLTVTELFRWYKDDFVEAAGSERAFIQKWAEETVADKVSQTKSLDFIDYDWSLNRPGNFADIQ